MKIVRKALCFVLLFTGLFLALDHIFYDKSNTSPVWEMIQDPKSEDLDILFIGSSHAFTAINPLIINEALGIRTAALSTSGQPIDLAYADLKTLLHYKKPKVIVFEAFKVKGLAKEVCELGKEGYLYNDLDGVRNPFYRARMVTEVLDCGRWLEGFSQLFRPMLTWKRFNNIMNPPKSYGNKPYGNILGFFPKEGLYKKGVTEQLKVDTLEPNVLVASVLRVTEQLKVDTLEQNNIAKLRKITDPKIETGDESDSFNFLHKFLQLTDQENIPVYIIKSPVARDGYVSLMKEVEQVSRQHTSVKGLYNYNTQLTDIGLTMEDFFNGGHLNRMGSGKFTVYLTDRIGEKLHKIPDYSKVCYYKSESVELLPNGLYRYHVDTFPNSLVKFVVKDRKGKILKETPYWEKKYIDMERVRYNNSLYFKIKPRKKFSETVSPEELDFKFMKDQGKLQNYSREFLKIEQKGNEIRLTNQYQETPVLYAFYVYHNGNAISKQEYSQINTFTHKFSQPGKYEIKAEIKTKEKLFDFKSAKITPILFASGTLQLP